MENKNLNVVRKEVSQPQVFNVRGKRVVLDREVAALVGMSTGNLNLTVKRNIHLFDEEKRFKLSEDECSKLQFAILNNGRGSNVKYLPYAFTAEGISMLEKVLKRDIPIVFKEEAEEVGVLPESSSEGTVVLYQPNENIRIDVRVDNETVWLTQEQMAQLFGTTTQNITIHIGNVFKEGELVKNSVCKESLQTARDGKAYTVLMYNLDVIISVGYRVKSLQGTRFRQWATRVLRNNLLHKSSLERRVVALEEQTKSLIVDTENRFSAIEEKVELIVDTKLPPVEMVFYEGESFKAYDFLCSLIEAAQKRIIVVDNYVDRKVLLMLNKRKEGVSATIYTHCKRSEDAQFKLDLEEANRKRSAPLIEAFGIRKDHDRFLVIDQTVYHLGPSVKDIGVSRCAVIKMKCSPETVMQDLK